MKPKDERLAELADLGNVAQFASFSPGPDPTVRFFRIRDLSPDSAPSFEEAVAALLSADRHPSQHPTVNIRSFKVGSEKGNPFDYGLSDATVVVARVRELAAAGFYTIVNETIDTNDGGVSGVSLGGVLEFTPFDTPRGVERPGVVSLERELGLRLLETIYSFRPGLEKVASGRERVEFSVHPFRVGYRRDHTILWETSEEETPNLTATSQWPNRLSRMTGDKAFGLMMAHLAGLKVPYTTVVSRTVAPFSFGVSTGSREWWMRTCPDVPQPGRFPTTYGWSDPYDVLAKLNGNSAAIASVLAQESVEAIFSGTGSRVSGLEPEYRAEGVSGWGDDYMLGRRAPEVVPDWVQAEVQSVGRIAESVFGPVRFEFVHDGMAIWVVQLHRSSSECVSDLAIGDYEPKSWLDYDPQDGLDRLRVQLEKAREVEAGVVVTAAVGLTSHIGELLRQAGVPARISPIDAAIGNATKGV